MRGLGKSFGGVRALVDVSVAIGRGTVHGLVGENGAGKSTLAKAIGGAHAPNEGEILVDGEPVRFASPRDALDRGIALIAQEIALVPPGHGRGERVPRRGAAPRRTGRPPGAADAPTEALDERVGFGLAPGAPVGGLRVADQQKVEILRALARRARMILMDEPTAALTADETDRLLGVIRRLAGEGTTIVLVSHYLDEVLAVAEAVTVMRDARVVARARPRTRPPQTLVAAMVGPRRRPDVSARRRRSPRCARRARGERPPPRRRRARRLASHVRAGEILGLAGLVGAGRTETARLLFGADRIDAGEILLDGEPMRAAQPARRDPPRHRDGAGEPQGRGPPPRCARSARTSRSPRSTSTARRLRPGAPARRAACGASSTASTSAATGIEATVGTLSGGNQQKVLFAALARAHPARADRRRADARRRRRREGGDPQAARRARRRAGIAIIAISSEIEEVLGLAHRTLALRLGRVVREFGPDAGQRGGVAGVLRTAEGAPA